MATNCFNESISGVKATATSWQCSDMECIGDTLTSMCFAFVSTSTNSCNRTNHVPPRCSSPRTLVLCICAGRLFTTSQKTTLSMFLGRAPCTPANDDLAPASTTPSPPSTERGSKSLQFPGCTSNNVHGQDGVATKLQAVQVPQSVVLSDLRGIIRGHLQLARLGACVMERKWPASVVKVLLLDVRRRHQILGEPVSVVDNLVP